MCLLISKPKGATIPEGHLLEGFDNNPDGAGYAFAKDNTVWIAKGFKRFNEFLKSYKAYCQGHDAIVHFRIATHGSKTEANCHPFSVGPGYAMGHNGVIRGVTIEGDESDTRAFIREVVNPEMEKNPDVVLEEEWIKKIKDRVGPSKLVFITKAGKMSIVNKFMGFERDGVWYSNSSFMARSSYVSDYRCGTGYAHYNVPGVTHSEEYKKRMDAAQEYYDSLFAKRREGGPEKYSDHIAGPVVVDGDEEDEKGSQPGVKVDVTGGGLWMNIQKIHCDMCGRRIKGKFYLSGARLIFCSSCCHDSSTTV